jgi:hypothetical protein
VWPPEFLPRKLMKLVLRSQLNPSRLLVAVLFIPNGAKSPRLSIRPWLPVWFCILLACQLGEGRAQILSSDVRVSNRANLLENEPDVAAYGGRGVAVWYRWTPTSLVGWAYSTDFGNTWTDGGNLPISPVNEGALGFPTICTDQASLFYVSTSLATPTGYTIGVWRGQFLEDRLEWATPVLVAPTLDYPYDSPRIVCDPVNGTLYVSCTRVTKDMYSDVFDHEILFVRSTDGGQTWGAPLVLSSLSCNGSRPVVGPEGEIYVVWEDFSAQQIICCKSTDLGQTFGPPMVVAAIQDNLASGPPDYLRSGRENPVYEHCGNGFVPNFPSIAVDRTNGPNRGTIYVTWTDYASGTVGPITATSGEREPNDWYGAATPVSIGQAIDGRVWSPDHFTDNWDFFSFFGTQGTTVWIEPVLTNLVPDEDPKDRACMCIVLECGPDTTQLTQLARTYSQEQWRGPMPPCIYTLPRTGQYFLSLCPPGSFTQDYILRIAEYHPGPGVARDHRDVILVSSSDGGMTWSPKVRVNDDDAFVDNSFPEVEVDGSGRVHMAWYDRRDDPECGARAHTYWAQSLNGGLSFEPNRRLSSQASSWQFHVPSSGTVGDHLALAADGERIYALWTQQGRPDVDIYGATIQPEPPVAILVRRLSAEAVEEGVRVSWSVAENPGLVGFRVHRSRGVADDFDPVEPSFIAYRGEGEYHHLDQDVEDGFRYWYRLELIHRDGTSQWAGPVEITAATPVSRLSWLETSPNPFVESVLFTLAVPAAGMGSVRVYDVVGREVALLHEGDVPNGTTSWTWEGRDKEGRLLPGGVYFIEARQGGSEVVRKILCGR